jgi:hypothetical protein
MNALTVIKSANTKSVAEFADEICGYLGDATVAWKKVADAFAEAEDMYGLQSVNFKDLCRDTGFSESKAYKLTKIAQSERLRQNAEVFSAVHSWTVLYAIAVLTEEEFARLMKKGGGKLGVDRPKIITMGMVTACKERKAVDREFSIYATIKIDYKMLFAQMIEGQHVEELEELLNDIESQIPYISIERTSVLQDEQARYLAQIKRKMIELARKDYNAALKNGLNRQMRKKGEAADQFFMRVHNMNRDEARMAFEADMELAFQHVDREYDQGLYWTEAQKIVDAKRDAVAEKSKAWANPYFHANSAIRAAAGNVNTSVTPVVQDAVVVEDGDDEDDDDMWKELANTAD